MHITKTQSKYVKHSKTTSYLSKLKASLNVTCLLHTCTVGLRMFKSVVKQTKDPYVTSACVQ